MKRRLTSAALALIMAATAVTAASCGQEDNLDSVGEDKIANATTLNIWGIKGEGTTDEAIAAVEEAMSEITQAQFNTAIKLELYTEAEYDKRQRLRQRSRQPRKPRRTAAETPPLRRNPPTSPPKSSTRPFSTSTDSRRPSTRMSRTLSSISSSLPIMIC